MKHDDIMLWVKCVLAVALASGGIGVWAFLLGVETARADFALGKCWTKDTDVVCIQKVYDR